MPKFRLLLYESFWPFRDTFCLFALIRCGSAETCCVTCCVTCYVTCCVTCYVTCCVTCCVTCTWCTCLVSKYGSVLKANCAVFYEFCETGTGKVILVIPLEMFSMDCQHLKSTSQTFIIPYTFLVYGLIWKGCNNIRTFSFVDFGRCVQHMSWCRISVSA